MGQIVHFWPPYILYIAGKLCIRGIRKSVGKSLFDILWNGLFRLFSHDKLLIAHTKYNLHLSTNRRKVGQKKMQHKLLYSFHFFICYLFLAVGQKIVHKQQNTFLGFNYLKEFSQTTYIFEKRLVVRKAFLTKYVLWKCFVHIPRRSFLFIAWKIHFSEQNPFWIKDSLKRGPKNLSRYLHCTW